MAERLLYLRGEVDVATADALRTELDDAARLSDADLLIDCSELTFIDSSGLAVLVVTQRNLAAVHRHLRLVNATEHVDNVMRIAGLTDMLRVNEPCAATYEVAG